MSTDISHSTRLLNLTNSIENNSANWFNGEFYQDNSWAQYEIAKIAIEMHTFSGSERVLDLGCGDGKPTALIATHKVANGHIKGIDNSKSQVTVAKATYDTISNIDFEEADAQTFDLHQLFDVIVSFSALHWCSDQQAVWSRIRSHLEINGVALISLN